MKLFSRDLAEEADVRPTLLGVVTLMFMLLFFLLATSSGQRLGAIDLRLAAPGEAPPLPHAGLVKDVRVLIRPPAVRVEFAVASTDIAAASETRELRAIDVPAKDGRLDVPGLLEALGRVHAIDPSQERAKVVPDDGTDAETLFAVLDAVRGDARSPLFPKPALE
jgi:hypothetical protein